MNIVERFYNEHTKREAQKDKVKDTDIYRLEFEDAVSVSDYLDNDIDDAADAAFESAANAEKDIERQLRTPKNVKIKSIEFVEHDSGNAWHASAYYNVIVEGPKAALEKIIKDLGYELENVTFEKIK